MSPRPFLISIARMHHISNPAKFRRLKRFAAQDGVSGLVKTGKPGVLVFDGDNQAISMFLEHARGLRYLDFHHVDTQPFLTKTNFEISKRLANGQAGLTEVKDMSEMIGRLEAVGLKEWCRTPLGMDKGPRKR